MFCVSCRWLQRTQLPDTLGQFVLFEEALEKSVRHYRFARFTGDTFDEQIQEMGPILDEAIAYALATLRSYKVRLVVTLQFRRDTDDSTSEILTSTRTQIIYPFTEIAELVDAMVDKIVCTANCAEMEGSGWVIETISSVELQFVQYDPLNAGSFMELPEALRRNRSIVNVHTTDTTCFRYAVLAAIHTVPNAAHPASYNHLLETLDFSCLKYPIPVNYGTVAKFEAINKISINIFGYENEIFPLRVSTLRYDR